MKCPWGCGWEGSPSEYSNHLSICSAYLKAKGHSVKPKLCAAFDVVRRHLFGAWGRGEIMTTTAADVINLLDDMAETEGCITTEELRRRRDEVRRRLHV